MVGAHLGFAIHVFGGSSLKGKETPLYDGPPAAQAGCATNAGSVPQTSVCRTGDGANLGPTAGATHKSPSTPAEPCNH